MSRLVATESGDVFKGEVGAPSMRGGKRSGAGRKPNGERPMTPAEKQAAYRARKAVVARDVDVHPGLKKTPTMSAMGADTISDR
jgi:hypothetical protein